jgi:hypothetical protein
LRPEATRPTPAQGLWGESILDSTSPLDGPPSEVRARLRALAEQESVLSLDDLLLRRMDSTLAVRDAGAAAHLRELLGWEDGAQGAQPAQRVGTGVSPR